MKARHLLPLMLTILGMLIPLSGWAQDLFDRQTIRFDVSKLLPIIPEQDITERANGYLSTETVNLLKDRCLSRAPERFPPDTHQNYCSCAAAATQATISPQILKDLQKAENRKLGNASFERYVSKVMKPCMDDAVEDIEYMQCIMTRDIDWRISLPVPYCRCSSREIRAHFEKFGLEEMMISWGAAKDDTRESPIETLWNNEQFLREREELKEKCVSNYLNPKYLRKY